MTIEDQVGAIETFREDMVRALASRFVYVDPRVKIHNIDEEIGRIDSNRDVVWPIKVEDHNGTYYIRSVGEIRLTDLVTTSEGSTGHETVRITFPPIGKLKHSKEAHNIVHIGGVPRGVAIVFEESDEDDWNIVDATSMFKSVCDRLDKSSLDLPFGESIVVADYMFSRCDSLWSITFKHGFGSKLESASYMFGGCNSLSNISGITKLSVGLDLSETCLSVECLGNIIKVLQPCNGQTLKLGSSLLSTAKENFSDEMAAAEANGWTFA